MASAASGIEPATVVIDNGTGYTKMGFAGNMEPSYLIPSVIAKSVPKVSPSAISLCLGSHPGFAGFVCLQAPFASANKIFFCE